jgi:ammonium transporter, Amt family
MSEIETLRVSLDTVWVTVASALVFFMSIGFALLESGLCQTKNVASVLAKNLAVYGISMIAYWSLGFAVQFSNGNDFIGQGGFFLLGEDNSPAIKEYAGIYKSIAWTGVPLATKFMFQVGFAATTATIISGAIAERTKLINYLLFCLLFVAGIYPVVGHWAWGGGWLAKAGFYDFAGSCVVHVAGGCAALSGAYILGPRKGRYRVRNANPFDPHSYTSAVLGGGILWLGWWGFNAGSTMSGTAFVAIGTITLNTNLAGAVGGLAALLTAWSRKGYPDLGQLVNGILGGLVAITASCAFVDTAPAFLIGLVAGVLVVFAAEWMDRWRIDDPVGAVAVHLFCGGWGTIALGLFAKAPAKELISTSPRAGVLMGGTSYQLGVQILGLVSVGLFVTIASTALWLALKSLLGLRVSTKHEETGLDVSQHRLKGVNHAE